MKKIIFLFSFLFLLGLLKAQNCNNLPSAYSSYDEAVSKVEAASFKINEGVNTSKSSWIQSAHYYSCDGETGYFIIKMNNRKYIHKGLPLQVWEGFKNANSFGSYYDRFIRYKYRLYLK